MESKCHQLVEALKDSILRGRYGKNSPLPSIRWLMQRHELSSSTVRAALGELERGGFVVRRRGCGTFVAPAMASRKIGLIVPGVAYSEFFPPIVARVSELAQAAGYTLCFGDIATRDPRRRAALTRRFIDSLIAEQVAGVLYEPIEFLSEMDVVNRENMTMLNRAGIPVVLLDSDIEPPPGRSGLDVVGIDNADAGSTIAEHLFACGARDLVFQLRPNWAPSVRKRLSGVKAACAQMPGATCRVLHAEPDDHEAVRRFLRSAHRPDAIICGNDRAAIRMLQSLKKIGLSVPQDVLLCGFDDIELAAAVTPSLTTIHQPCAEIGTALFETLLWRIGNPSNSPREILLPAPLVVRESTQRGRTPGRAHAKPRTSRIV